MFSAIAVPSIQIPVQQPLTPTAPVDTIPVPGRLPPVAVASPVAPQPTGDRTPGNSVARAASTSANTADSASFTAAPLQSNVTPAAGASSSFLAQLFGQGDQGISTFDFSSSGGLMPTFVDSEVMAAISQLKYKPSDAALPRQWAPTQPLTYQLENPVQTVSQPAPASAAAAPEASPPPTDTAYDVSQIPAPQTQQGTAQAFVDVAPPPATNPAPTPKPAAVRKSTDALTKTASGTDAYQAASQRPLANFFAPTPSVAFSL